MPLPPGSRLGPYEIVSPLGAGGMGEVYRARDPRLGRDVAVKILPEAAADDPEHLSRFEREARAVAALSHPNVLAIFDVGHGDVPFLVTELLEGETLRGLLDRGPLSARRAVEIGMQLAAGLAAAHERGLVHRDLKPANVFVTTDGQVKILDFGLAKEIATVSEVGDATTRPQPARGAAVGTLRYMAPEQLSGLATDTRSDIFTCGALLFEMLTGRRAFRGESPAETIGAILRDLPTSLEFPPATPPALADVVRRALAKDPSQRFQSARELLTALELIAPLIRS